MTSRRKLIHALFVLALPIIVAALGWSWPVALLLVVLALLWRWALVFAEIRSPSETETVVLETISASHFAEKARWCLDRLGVEYREDPCSGILGVLFTGRTVPKLHFRTGIVRSSLGNSAEILRYLWGQYGVTFGDLAEFLEPTKERLALEGRLDKYGAHLQVWAYYHILPHPEITVRLWGIDDPQIPWWQRALLRPLFPIYAAFLKRVFRITDESYSKAVERIDSLLGDIETKLSDGRKTIFGDDGLSFIDITFAALSGLWLMPANYGGGRANACLVARNRLPGAMQDDIERWSEDYPRATALVNRLYAEERLR